jgi:hypothetical protein
VAIYTDGKAYSTDARIAAMANSFIGFCLATTAVNDIAPIQIVGSEDSLSGLTIASNYYLSNAGADVQDQTADGTGLSYFDNSVTHWQSFTTGSGVVNISAIALNMRQINGSGSSCVLTIKTGSGTGGTTIYSGLFNMLAAGWQTTILDIPVAVSANTQYTFILSANSSNNHFYVSSDSGYAGGTSDSGGTSDMDFFTYTSTGSRGAIGTSAGTVSKKVGLALGTSSLLILNT